MSIPLVFLHGFLGHPDDWIPVCRHLPDLPCHPSTDFHIPSWPKIHLIGYSMGGRIAMHYAAQFPERIASLTLASAHPGLTTPEEKKLRWEHDQKWAHKIRTEDFWDEWYAQPIFDGFVPDLTKRKKQNREHLAQTLLRHSLAHQPRFSFPHALILVGERDTKYRTLYPDATLIADAAHMIHLENPHDFARNLIDFIHKSPV